MAENKDGIGGVHRDSSNPELLRVTAKTLEFMVRKRLGIDAVPNMRLDVFFEHQVDELVAQLRSTVLDRVVWTESKVTGEIDEPGLWNGVKTWLRKIPVVWRWISPAPTVVTFEQLHIHNNCPHIVVTGNMNPHIEFIIGLPGNAAANVRPK